MSNRYPTINDYFILTPMETLRAREAWYLLVRYPRANNEVRRGLIDKWFKRCDDMMEYKIKNNRRIQKR